MSDINSRLFLLLPGLFGPQPGLSGCGAQPKVPMLERLLSRARQADCAGSDAVSTLFHLLLPAAAGDNGWPSAAVERYGITGSDDGAWWMHADPVWLKPDMERLMLFDQRALDIGMEEESILLAEINAHFADQGWQLEATSPGRWYLRLEQTPRITTSALSQVVGRSVFPFLPQGEQASVWHGLLNEVQMLMYQSPVNEARRQRGLPEVSGVWPWGGGRLPASAESVSNWSRVYADDPLVKGLCRHAGIVCEPLAAMPETLEPSGDCLIYRDGLLGSMLDADAFEWVSGIEQLEPSFHRLREGLSHNRPAVLLLCPCNGHSYRTKGRDMWRIWRRTRSITDYLDKTSIP